MTADSRLNIKFIKNTDTEVIINDEVFNIWRKYQQTDIKDNEACGVLIGGYNEKQNKIFIDLCTESQKSDLRKRTFFTLKDPFHQKKVNDIFISSQQTQFYLGTWHSHPENHPSPSGVDLRDWKNCIKRNSHNKFMVFAIIGIKETLIKVYEVGKNSMTIQTKQNPLSSNEHVDLYKTLLNKSGINYNNIGVLLDNPTHNIILILFSDKMIVDLFRMNLDVEDFSNNTFSFTSLKQVEVRVLQGKYITAEQLISIESIQEIWDKTNKQKLILNKNKLKEYISRIWINTKKIGRGKSFTEKTKKMVRATSHGRCMYKGCGIKLTVDKTTGIEGNYGYLAHNVASSEQAARGLIVISEKLSDDPNNVLHLCDKHHRLIDKIAVSTHPAHLLSKMREEFIELSETLLDGLKYQPCLTFLILFPVRRNFVEKPTSRQVADSLSIKKLRQSERLSELLSNETSHLDETSESYWSLMKVSIQRISDSLASQCAQTDKSVALFAFGAMPTLIALGAMIGNKKGYIPILRDRSSGQWGWLNNSLEKDFFIIKNLDQLNNNEEEIIISFAFTAEPEAFKYTSQELNNTRNVKRIEIIAKKLGNDCLSHPDAGNYFSHQLQQLFHKLREINNVHKIHILPCMSNAASVYLGMAIDRYHPDILLYEYADTTDGLKTMMPVLSLSYKEGKTNLEYCKKV